MNDIILNKKFYLGIARSLLATGQYHGLAKRYISVLRRRRALKRGEQEALALGRDDNPLTRICFTPPLSIAGQVGHRAAIEAEMMMKRGVPLATELDPRGLHRGTSLGDVTDQLRRRTGKDYNELEILNLYQAMMSGHPKLLQFHPTRRYRVIPALAKRLEGERNDLECRLHQALMSQDGRIFAACVPVPALAGALDAGSDSVVVGYAGSQLKVNGTAIQTLWGCGKGLAVLGVDDLRTLLVSDTVTIETNLAGWKGWINFNDGVSRAPKAKEFKFYGGGE